MFILDRIKEIIAGRPIIKSLIVRNLKDRYGGAVLGVFWSVVNPLLIALVITFVFAFVMKSEIKNYPLFVLSGLFPWFFFSNSITESANSMRQNQDILNRFVLPKEIVPLSVVFSNAIHAVIGLALVIPVFIIFNPHHIIQLLLLPFVLILFCAFTFGISMCLSVLTVYCRDIAQLLGVGTMFLFWVTPIFYPLEAIPAHYHWMVHGNPIFSYIRLFQLLLYEGTPGTAYLWASAVLFSGISLLIGYVVFVRREGAILKYL